MSYPDYPFNRLILKTDYFKTLDKTVDAEKKYYTKVSNIYVACDGVLLFDPYVIYYEKDLYDNSYFKTTDTAVNREKTYYTKLNSEYLECVDLSEFDDSVIYYEKDVDITKKFKMVMVDTYTLSPPAPKIYLVDIPGGNGQLDLTDAMTGDTAYNTRSQEFVFCFIYTTEFEKQKTDVSNFLHGKAFDYQLTFDPGYTYRGRFTIAEYEHTPYADGLVGAIKITIEGYPYKYKEGKIYRVDGVGGITLYLDSGRKRVCPTFETDSILRVIYKNEFTKLYSGIWTINNILFSMGENEIYLNSYPVHNLEWGNLLNGYTDNDGLTWGNITWGMFATKPLYEWYKSNGYTTIRRKTWAEVSLQKWADISVIRWKDLIYMINISDIVQNIFIKYDWGDL